MARKKSQPPRKPPRLESGEPTTIAAAPKKTRRKKPKRRRLSIIPPIIGKLIFYGGMGVALILAWIYITLPNIDNLNRFSKAPSIIVKAENGQIVGSFGDVYGDYIPYEDLPASLVHSILATEDRNFFHHFGIDPIGLIRAMVANVRAGHVVQGGSTITQQVAKNVFLTPERSLLRKLREMMLAFKLEIRFSKEEILSIYANRVYLGAGCYGIDAAAKRYFDKSGRELTLSESAVLAGLLKAPSKFAPTSNPELSKKRAQQVLLNMQDAEYLTEKQAQSASEALDSAMTHRNKSPQSSLYFADWIMEQLQEYVGSVQQDLVVVTTINPEWQLLAEKVVNDQLTKHGETMNVSQAALVAMSPDGAVRTMVGGKNYGQSQYNRAAQSLRQPGSSFKLFVYLAALEYGMRPDSLVEDDPITIPIPGGKWTPKNYTGRYLGTMPLRQAVSESINTVAVRVSQETGIDNVIDVARRLGVTANLDPVPSLALGSTEVSLLEMTAAYAHLSANGAIVYPYGIIQIDTSQGDTLYRRQPPPSGYVLRPDVVGMMNEMLMGVINNGTGGAARIGRPAAGKTGTTSDYKDAWFMGYTPDLTTGVWVGNDDNTPMKKVTGGTLPAPIWHDFMQAALADVPVRQIPIHDVPSPLPWQQDMTAPADIHESHDEDGEPAGNKHGGELGQTFWNKLLR
ncbi:MAG: penicillin-binding protein 1A [Rickettsiales bacterium]|nr:penicillin-binding protein 1A [Rickettsiales bacterium]